MTVKKVNPGQDLQSDVVNLLKQNQASKKRAGASEEEERSTLGIDESRVNLSVSRAINSELNPELISTERRAKIEKLKELIASGEYKPSSMDVARALTEEVAFEIFTSGGNGAVSFFEDE